MCFILTLGHSIAYCQSAREIAQQTFPSVVLIVMEDGNRQPLSQGSGFFVSDGIIATNFHVIEGAESGYAKVIGKQEKLNIEGTVGIDHVRDLVLLSVGKSTNPALPFGDESTLAVGDEIYAVGNPQGLEGTFSRGIISGIRQVGQNSLLQLTAPISPGSSGGPILDKEGKVVGVAVATFTNGQNLNFAIPVSYLTNLLSNVGAITSLSLNKENISKKTILDELGGATIESVQAQKFAWGKYSNFQSGDFSFSIRNGLREHVKNVSYIIIFYESEGDPIDVYVGEYPEAIPAGLAKLVTGSTDDRVEKLNSPYSTFTYRPPFPRAPINEVEIRILSFDISN